MKRLLALLWLGVGGFMPTAAFAQAGRLGDLSVLEMGSSAAVPLLPVPVMSVVPNRAAMRSDLVVTSTGVVNGAISPALEITGNSGAFSTANNYSGVVGASIINWSTTADVYCCYGDALCDFGAGVHHGWPILRQPAGGNFNFQYFPLAAWQQLYCVSTAASSTINAILLR